MITIALTGGIGSGKSVVSKIIASLGYNVYDCDSRAKILMDCNDDIKNQIAALISQDVITPENQINRPLLANIVFNNPLLLKTLNKVVHTEVINDFIKWRSSLSHNICWVETAILYESNLHQVVNYAWNIISPIDIRIKRVMQRNNMSEEDVISRINSQKMTNSDLIPTINIVNDDITPILPQIEAIIPTIISI